MRKNLNLLTICKATLLILCLSVAACTSGGGDDSSGDDDGGDGDGGGGVNANFLTDCGSVIGGSLKNPAKSSDGKAATVQITGSNQAIVKYGTTSILVKFAGLSQVSDFRRDIAIDQLEELASKPAVYFESKKDCTDQTEGGGTAFVGHLFTADGVSYNEKLLNAGFGSVDYGDPCTLDLLTSCYQGLVDGATQYAGVVSDFLWKPEADKDGNLVVLLNPYDAVIKVNGETLVPTGPSNGRGSTARGNKPGCAYGANAKVEVTDDQGRVVLFPGGKTSFTIVSPCDRLEFK